MVLSQYEILEMTNKIFGGRYPQCGVLIEMALVVHAKIFISEIVEKDSTT